MAYAHLEMFLYRPFLHYVSQDIQAKGFDKRSYACAAACVSVSRNTIHITAEMKRRQLLQGSYWFYMYTTFFAVISLVFYVLENPQSITSADILRDAHEGKDTLAGLAANSLAADLCSRMLKVWDDTCSEPLSVLTILQGPIRTTRRKAQRRTHELSLSQETFSTTSCGHPTSIAAKRSRSHLESKRPWRHRRSPRKLLSHPSEHVETLHQPI